MLTTRLLSGRLLNRQSLKIVVINQTRYLTSSAPSTPESTPQQAKPEQYGTFRSPADSLGVRDPPVVDHNNWIKRKQQKLRDFVDYEKAFAAHASERRHL